MKRVALLLFLLIICASIGAKGVTNTGTFTPINTIPLIITNIAADPSFTSIGSFVNISCNIYNESNLTSVQVNFSDLGTTETMTLGSDATYYYNDTYAVAGIYYYHIYIADNVSNSLESDTYSFQITSGGGGGGGIIELYLPTDALFENQLTILVVKVCNPTTGEPQPGYADNISCYVFYPDGTALLDGSHPYEYGPGVYVHNITVGLRGNYVSYATVVFGSLTYMDTGFFTVRWDIYENFTAIQERVHLIITSGYLGRENQTRMIVYHITQRDLTLDEIQTAIEESTGRDTLRDTAIQGLFQGVFSVLLFIVIAIVGTILWSKRRTRKMIHQITPQHIAEKLITPEKK